MTFEKIPALDFAFPNNVVETYIFTENIIKCKR